MLILTRKAGESILIDLDKSVDPATPVGELFANGPIAIQIAECKGDRAKIAISADTRFMILRDELYRP